MTKQKIFMPPQVVRQDEGLDPASITLTDVRKLYHKGGKVAMRWARRILRQEGILKSSPAGDVSVPVAIDLQLGPEIFAAFLKEDCDKAGQAFDTEGIPATFISADKGTLAFFVDHEEELSDPILAEFPLEKINPAGAIMIDGSKAKIKSIMRAVGRSDETVGFSCYGIEDPGQVAGLDITQLFLLKADDIPVQEAQIVKVDDELGIVLGWAIISTISGEPYFDKQGDHIPDNSMLEAATDFMLHSRVQGDMHEKVEGSDGEEVAKGVVVFAWPMTAEIAKAYGIEVNQTGLMIAIKPSDSEILEKYRDGTYTGFSISGKYLPEYTEEVD